MIWLTALSNLIEWLCIWCVVLPLTLILTTHAKTFVPANTFLLRHYGWLEAFAFWGVYYIVKKLYDIHDQLEKSNEINHKVLDKLRGW
jgi:hypothetical protein